MSVSKILQLSSFWRIAARRTSVRSSQHVANYAKTLQNLPETKITELSNGFRVATEATDCPASTVGVWLDAGSRYETAENNGVANFLEHIVFKGSQGKSPKDMEAEMAKIGAKFDSYTDREETAFYGSCLSSDAATVVNILGDALGNVKIDDDIIEEQRNVILAELEEAESDLKQVAFDYLHLTAYQGTPLQKSVFGTTVNIKKITKEDVAHYARNSIIAPRMVLCATGNVNHDEIVKAAEKSFGSIPLNYTGEIPTLDYCRFTGSDVRVRDDWYPFAHCAIAIDTCGFGNADVYPLMLAKTCVGSWNKTSLTSSNTYSTLVQNIYKEKRCHSFDSFHLLYRDTGLWGCYFVMDKMILDDFMFNLQNEWMKMCINVTEADLVIAKNMLRSQLLLSMDDPRALCAEISKQILLTGERSSLEEIDEAIQAVTLQQLRDTCSKYIYDRCPAVSGVGPIEALTDYNRIRSNMTWLRY